MILWSFLIKFNTTNQYRLNSFYNLLYFIIFGIDYFEDNHNRNSAVNKTSFYSKTHNLNTSDGYWCSRSVVDETSVLSDVISVVRYHQCCQMSSKFKDIILVDRYSPCCQIFHTKFDCNRRRIQSNFWASDTEDIRMSFWEVLVKST